MNPNKENANVPHGPEATNLTLAESIKKEFALLEVFAQDLADAHMRGDISPSRPRHDRPPVLLSGQSIEYVKKFGLNLPNAISIAKPAKHPEVLIEQIVKFSAALQGNFAGAIGWDAFNLFLAPYLVGCDDQRMKQLAQILIFEFAQQAVARGGQSIFTDLNLYWECPDHFDGRSGHRTEAACSPATTMRTTSPNRSASSAPCSTCTWKATPLGRPFFFPKPNVHMTEKFFKSRGHEDFLNKISDVREREGQHLLRVRPGQHRQDIRVLPPDLQAGARATSTTPRPRGRCDTRPCRT